MVVGFHSDPRAIYHARIRDVVSFGFASVHWGGTWSHSCSRGFPRAIIGFIVFRMVHSGVPRGHRVHWVSRGFTRAGGGLLGFIRVHVHSLMRWLGSCGFAWGLLMRSEKAPGSFRLAWVHSCATCDRRLLSHLNGFTRARLVVIRFIRVRKNSIGRSHGRSSSFGLTFV